MTTTNLIKMLSLGGGLDSFAMLLWAVLKYLATGDRSYLPDVVIFADVTNNVVKNNRRANPSGFTPDPGEWPSTYRHIEEIVGPLCEKHEIEFGWLTTDQYPILPNAGAYRSRYAYAKALKMFYGCMQKTCTSKAKVERIARYCDDRFPDMDVEMWIGFEANELDRIKKDPRGPNANLKYKPGQARRRNRWPLMENELCRCRCEALVRDAGYPIPRKSACTFCGHNTRGDLLTLRTDLPETFEMVKAYEENSKITQNGDGVKLRFSGDPDWKLDDYIDGRRLNGKQMKPYARAKKGCEVCGLALRATKATGCDYLQPSEYVFPAPAGRPSLPVLQTPEVAPNKLDKKIQGPVKEKMMAANKRTKLITTEKYDLGEISLFQESDGEFTVEFTNPLNKTDDWFTHKSLSACAKHLFALSKGSKDRETYESKGKKIPGVGGASSKFWGGGPLDLSGASASKKAPKDKPAKKTKQKSSKTRQTKAPKVTATPEKMPAQKMPKIDRTNDTQVQYMVFTAGPKDPKVEGDISLLDEVGGELPKAKWADLFRTLMADGTKRTFNGMMIEVANLEAIDGPDEAQDALWALVEDEGYLFHTMSSPVMFWKPAAGESIPAEAQALLEDQQGA
jgi:hypothetical protein